VIERLPEVRGRYIQNARLDALTWFRVGGPADVLFTPADVDDLQNFLAKRPKDIEIRVVGVGSNLLVRDGGLPGVTIRLAKGFNQIEIEGDNVIAGAAALDVAVARKAQKESVSGLEFYRGIPGAIGGALRMNAGSYGTETKDILISCKALDSDGNLVILRVEDMGYTYRHSEASEDLIFIEARFQGRPDNSDDILARMTKITDAREESQPVKSRTGGSTFKNPVPATSGGLSAWQVIDAAGCRGLKVGDAQVSELHCNFLINLGEATAANLEDLGEDVRARVKENSGVVLDWEIKRLGRKI
jgi:UDP-N-acetylmuramate dehydrogenase